MGEALLDEQLQMPRFPVVANVDGNAPTSLLDIRRTLQDQITGTVRWTDCITWLVDRGCELFIELGPGAVLTGLVQRIHKGADVVCVNDPASVGICAEKVRALA
jgi:[acyl-carrier-protein] S-malonyltransferase